MKPIKILILFCLANSYCAMLVAQNKIKPQMVTISDGNLKSIGVLISEVSKDGMKAIKIVEDKKTTLNQSMAIIKNLDFKNGTIELEVNGSRSRDSDTTNRGFIGLAFRVQEKDTISYECFYIRPDNGRANDQLRRNHSTQYISEPQYPWYKLRKDFPGVYESYADMESGKWINIKIEVQNEKARLYVGNAPQPCLVVNDLRHRVENGGIALWIGPGTEGYFRNIKILKSEL